MNRALLLAALLTSFPPMLAAQELRLKRDVPRVAWAGCPTASRPGAVPDEQRQDAGRLATAATQANILGDNAAALDMLTRAAARDPGSERIAYRLARTLEQLERRGEAVGEYCRYLALAPDGADATEARERIAALTEAGGFAVPEAAATAFAAGIAHYDAGRLTEADSAFGAALLVVPGWADALYDRGVVRLALGRRDEASDDLRRYLEINPGTRDFNDVVRALGSPRGLELRYSAGSALASGLILPGLGHFTTGRPARGLLFLGGAAGAVAAGLMWQRTEVQCLSPPVNGACPREQVLSETTERPYLVPSLGAAAAVGVLGAFDAFRGVRRRNASAQLLRVGGSDGAGGAALRLPSVDVAPGGPRLSLIRLTF